MECCRGIPIEFGLRRWEMLPLHGQILQNIVGIAGRGFYGVCADPAQLQNHKAYTQTVFKEA